MTYPMGTHGFSNGRYDNGSSALDGYPEFGRRRVVLVTIHSAMLPSIFHERSALHRTRAVVLPPEESEFDVPDMLPGTFRGVLPPMPPPVSRMNRPQARLVRGEILRDAEGRIYENVDGKIRVLHKLVSGVNGQVFELIPPAARETTSEPAEGFEEAENQGRGERQEQQSDEPGPRASVAGPSPTKGKPAPCRKLFLDPGQRRVVRLGDFKSMLASQLAHPERLRDTHRLACYLQVYESATVQRLEALAASLLGDPARVGELQLLTERVATQLGLASLPRSRPRVPANFPREAGLLLPSEKVFRLQLAHDPTAEDASAAARQPPQNSQTQAVPEIASAAHPKPIAEATKKTTIPDCFVKPWEFKMTRDDVLYDMNVTAAFNGWFSSLCRRLKGRIGGRREWKKWRVLLYGKIAEEQLWGIRPPKGALSHPAVRGWVLKTLEAAGYEPRAMLLEWEIFWRRKGV